MLMSRRPTATTRGMSSGRDSNTVGRPSGSRAVVTRPRGLWKIHRRRLAGSFSPSISMRSSFVTLTAGEASTVPFSVTRPSRSSPPRRAGGDARAGDDLARSAPPRAPAPRPVPPRAPRGGAGRHGGTGVPRPREARGRSASSRGRNGLSPLELSPLDLSPLGLKDPAWPFASPPAPSRPWNRRSRPVRGRSERPGVRPLSLSLLLVMGA